MNTRFFIARRYFFSRHNRNAVNIIAAISLVGLLVGSAALVIVLGALNGLEDLVRSFYSKLDPDLKIELAEGKYFSWTEEQEAMISKMEGVAEYSRVLEERAVLNYQDREYIVSAKGVDDQYGKVNALDSAILHGEAKLSSQSNRTVIGNGVAYFLSYSRIDLGQEISAFFLQADASAANFSNAFSSTSLQPTGIFAVQAEYDGRYALMGLEYLQSLVGREKSLTAIEVKLAPHHKVEEVQEELQAKLGSAFTVKNRDEQQAMFFKVMKSEALFAYLIFALILAIASFTIIGSLAMLMLDKKRDLRTLWAMGFTLTDLRRTLMTLGVAIGGAGAFIGTCLGALLVVLQQEYGLIHVGSGYLVEYYPVAFRWTDAAIVLLTVMALSSLSAFVATRRLQMNLIKSA